MFDTRTAAQRDYSTSAELETAIGHRVTLTDVQYFHSQEPAYLRQRRIDGFICFGPMAFAFALLVTLVLLGRYNGIETDHPTPHL